MLLKKLLTKALIFCLASLGINGLDANFCQPDFLQRAQAQVSEMGANPFNLNTDDPEALFETVYNVIENMSPEERSEFEEASKKISDELEVFVNNESAKMGITPEQYFETEFFKLFENENVALAKSDSGVPGMKLYESDFKMPFGNTQKQVDLTKSKDQKTNAAASPEKSESENSIEKQKDSQESKPESKTRQPNNELRENGNWLKKRAFSVEGKKLLEESKNLLKEIREKRSSFYAKKIEEIDSLLDNFFQKIGVERGNTIGISEYIETVVGQKINKLSNIGKKGTHEEKVDDFVLFQIEDKVDLFKTELSNLKAESDSIGDIDRMASEQINTLDYHIQSAEDNFMKIEEALGKIHETYDDKMASQYFNQIDNYYDQILAIDKHVKETGIKNIEKINELIASSTSKIEDKIKKLSTDVTAILDKLEKSSSKQGSERNKQKINNPIKEANNDSSLENYSVLGSIKAGLNRLIGRKESVFA